MLPLLDQEGRSELGTHFTITVVKNISSNMHKIICVLEIHWTCMCSCLQEIMTEFLLPVTQTFFVWFSVSDTFFKKSWQDFAYYSLLQKDVIRLVFWPCGNLLSLFLLFCSLLLRYSYCIKDVPKSLLDIFYFWFQSNPRYSQCKYFQ